MPTGSYPRNDFPKCTDPLPPGLKKGYVDVGEGSDGAHYNITPLQSHQ